mmetsp:Transcript_41533/g.104426  ORF Transcript_41533/g.104426 Transcript_41533/m.104426 type:complete len:258 (-) Transcript_41533:168-941(-)
MQKQGKSQGPDDRLFMSSNRDCMNLSLVSLLEAVHSMLAEVLHICQPRITSTARMCNSQLRNKANELRNSLDHMLQTLHVCPDRVAWATALEQFGSLNIQYYHLVDQLRPMLKHWVVHPRVVDATNHEILPLMMSTRILPDMEKEETELLKNHESAHSNTPAKGQYVELLAEIEEFNSLVDFLTTQKSQAAGPGPLSAKNALLAQIKAPLSKSSAAAVSTLQKQGQARAQSARKGAGAKAVGADLLLLAAVRGEGLK